MIKKPEYHTILFNNMWRDQFHYKFSGRSAEMVHQQEKQVQKIIERFDNVIDKEVFLEKF